MDNTQLAARDITIEERPQFDRRGNPINWRFVTFFVGNHGPFNFSDVAAQLTGDVIKQKIADQVAELQDIEATFPGTSE